MSERGRPSGEPVLELEDVRVWVPDGTEILRGISWTVRPGEQWALLGPNGSGKSTLLSLAGAVRHPSAGAVTVLGGRLGEIDVREVRTRIGAVDPLATVHDWLSVEDVVLTGATATAWPLWDRYGAGERARAKDLLQLVGCEALAGREFGTCSQGERQRVRIARALMPAPPLLLLDEPATGLDLPAREALIAALSTLAAREPALATVLVAHHLEELPAVTTHALLLRAGQAVACGPVAEALTGETVSACFGIDVRLTRHEDGRWSARAAPGWARSVG